MIQCLLCDESRRILIDESGRSNETRAKKNMRMHVLRCHMPTASATNEQSSIDNADSLDNVNFLSADQSITGIDECESSDDEGANG